MFQIFGLLFNLGIKAIKDIFNDFDVSGDQELDYGEFKLFAMACIDKGEFRVCETFTAKNATWG